MAASPFPLSPTPAWGPAERGLAGIAADRVQIDGAPLPVAFTLHRGDTLSAALRRLGLEPAEAHRAVEAAREYADLRRLRAGDPATVYLDPGGSVAAFDLILGHDGRVRASRTPDGGWGAELDVFEKTVRRRLAVGELEVTLEGALREAEAPSSVAYQMADVLQWDLDFNRDLQRGDGFRTLFEEQLVEGRPAGLGRIQALVYTTRGRVLEAYRFDELGYYDAEGRPLRKMFLRSPLPYSRVTSRFSQRRFHPILKTYRPHYGIDYGAPVGTPVRVTANGVVSFAGWDKGGGRTVKVRHPNGYLTAYLHLSGFAKGVRSGARVEQGEVIAYVGSTGLSTAPHLDYRVQKKGKWIDPLSLRPEAAPPIPEERRQEFLALRDALRTELELSLTEAG